MWNAIMAHEQSSKRSMVRQQGTRPRPYSLSMNRLLLPLWLFLLVSAARGQRPFDVLIRNGHIIDGTGSPWYSGDVGIRAGRITAIGNLSRAQANRVIDAKEMVVAPGFIDMMGQSELTILVEPHLPSKIFQGITTEITGEGDSVAPLNDVLIQASRIRFKHLEITPDWRTLDQYFGRLEKQGMGVNLGTFVGATQVRRFVLGDADRAPTPAQLDEMKSLVRQAMLQGALGVSTALEYPPAPYASTEELVALASEASKFGGIYASHIRTEGEGEMAALDEAIRIGREANIPVEIFHIKTEGKPSFGKMPDVISKIEAARHEGLDITADIYAYPAWANDLSAAIPPWAQDGGAAKMIERLRDPATRARIRRDLETPSTSWENEWQEISGPQDILILSVHNPELFSMRGKTLAEVAKIWNADPMDALFDLVIKDDAFTLVAIFAISEPDIVLALQQPWVSIGCDMWGTSPDGPLGKEPVHPRGYGTFPRVLRKYVREEKKLTLPDAIRKFTALPAQRMRLVDRGVLKQGMWADVVIFDPDRVRDLATFENPHRLAEGMEYVLVNGIPVIDGGKATNALPGKVLRGPGYESRARH
jgi:N-acyl-D-amino-acid deacylase